MESLVIGICVLAAVVYLLSLGIKMFKNACGSGKAGGSCGCSGSKLPKHHTSLDTK